MVELADDVGRAVYSYVRQPRGYVLARLRNDASIALAQEDWARFQLLNWAKLRLLRLQYLGGRNLNSLASEAAAWDS